MRAEEVGLFLLVLTAGCPSLSSYQTAEPLPPGRWRAGAALALVSFADTEQDIRASAPQVELTLRRGLYDDLDAGVKLYLFGAEVGAKWRFLRGRWSCAAAPALGLVRTTDTRATTEALFLFGHLPLIVTRDLSARRSLSFGPKLMVAHYRPVGGGTAYGVLVGGFMNVDLRWGAWHLVPEIDAYRTASGEVPVAGVALHGGVGVSRDF